MTVQLSSYRQEKCIFLTTSYSFNKAFRVQTPPTKSNTRRLWRIPAKSHTDYSTKRGGGVGEWNIVSGTFLKILDAFKRLNCAPNYVTQSILTCWLGNSECSLEPKSFLLTKPSASSRESFLLAPFEAVTQEWRRPPGLHSASARTATQSTAALAAPATLPAPSLPCQRGDTHLRAQQKAGRGHRSADMQVHIPRVLHKQEPSAGRQ